jgi:hypothetical protein
MTEFKGDSKMEVFPGSVPSRGGPHPTKVHVDEVEMMTEHDAEKMEEVRPDAHGVTPETMSLAWEGDDVLIQPECEDWDDS